MTTILVAEDDATIREVLATALADDGYTVITAVDGNALWEAAVTQPAAILLDLNMPGMNGADVVHRLRIGATTAAIPIIILSGRPGLEHLVAELGAAAAFRKPFNLHEVVAAVAHLAGPPQ